MTNKNIKRNIIKLLLEKELTAKEIFEALQIPKKRLWVYLKTLVDEDKITRISSEKPYKYKAIPNREQELLTHLTLLKSFFVENLHFLTNTDEIRTKTYDFILQNERIFRNPPEKN